MADALTAEGVKMLKLTLLHTHANAGELWADIFREIFLHGFLDTLNIIPFLFVTYIFMEFLEHRASDKVIRALKKSGKAGPLIGGALGVIPQCGFSTVGATFYSTKIISLGTLLAIFLSTSDEMLPILISGKMKFGQIATILIYKVLVAVLAGFIIDGVTKLLKLRGDSPSSIHNLCEKDNCHCENGILRSAIHHTLTIGLFLLIVTVALNALVFFIGSERIASIMYDKPFVSHLISAVVGLVPNCAMSVALTNFYVEGFITAGTMLSGLFSGAGVGLLVLFKTNKNIKKNITIVGILISVGVIFGAIFDLIYPLIF